MPDSCTHIAGQCAHHNNHIINIHNTACQLTHAAIRTSFKGGGTIYPPHDLRLVSSNAGIKQQTQEEDIDAFTVPPSQDHEYHSQQQQHQPLFTTDWLNHSPPTTPPPRQNHRVDVSIYTKFLPPPTRGSGDLRRRRRGGPPVHSGMGPLARRPS